MIEAFDECCSSSGCLQSGAYFVPRIVKVFYASLWAPFITTNLGFEFAAFHLAPVLVLVLVLAKNAMPSSSL